MTDLATTALTVKQLDHHGRTSHDVYTAGFYGGSREAVVRAVLGKAPRGVSDIGEVLATIADVDAKDAMGWYGAWDALGDRIGTIAGSCAASRHLISAASAYLRAAGYHAVAVDAASGMADAERLLCAFRKHRDAWEGFVATTAWPVERIDIPYEGSSMPGWLFRPDSSGVPRPTIVGNNGSDGAITAVWAEVAVGSLERGYNVLLFDGPGQQSMLFEKGIPFRYDWEHVITPVVDMLLARDDVDASRLALYGVSQGGYWVPRALAFEHRFAAAVADGGVVDVSRSWFENIPGPLAAMYRKGDKAAFDRDMTFGMKLPGAGTERTAWAFRARPYGSAEGYAAVLDEVVKYDLRDVAHQIATPLLITDPDGEQFFAGQSAELAALVPGSTLIRFTQAEGAAGHCQPLARMLTEQRMFDWLDERLA